ncbi:MAG TPA: nitroreductase family protein [Trebonia sp.]|jgi:nitroreductase|nr:nitroreductase family protein [Trebonia sp.]
MPDLTPDELLTTTRSVRKRLDLTRPVPLSLVRECLQVAQQAPSGGNAQQWHWVVITDPQVRAQVGDYYRRSTEVYLAGREPADEAGQRLRDSAAYLGQHMGEVPVLLLACVQSDSPWPADGNQAGLWGSLLPAAWSYMLACRSRGLGTAWTTLHLRYEKEVAELLGLPDNVRQGVLIPTAYYTGETFRPGPRRTLTLHENHW